MSKSKSQHPGLVRLWSKWNGAVFVARICICISLVSTFSTSTPDRRGPKLTGRGLILEVRSILVSFATAVKRGLSPWGMNSVLGFAHRRRAPSSKRATRYLWMQGCHVENALPAETARIMPALISGPMDTTMGVAFRRWYLCWMKT